MRGAKCCQESGKRFDLGGRSVAADDADQYLSATAGS